jgi:precorrin-6Y C5,15-methyltransferase (decarboxylating)
VVLASGDPLHYGVGVLLAAHFAPQEMIVMPQPSAFSLAAARLLWPVADSICLSLHGRPIEALRRHLTPGVRIIALTSDGTAPALLAELLCKSGWRDARLTLFEHMGGPRERRIEATAATWPAGDRADLNVLAIDCPTTGDVRALSRLAGLPDDAFVHDGQITKRMVRATSLALLAPLPGELLWDVGAGCGSIGIEWLRAARGMHAIAIERAPARAAFIAQNAAALGVPEIRIVTGTAPAALADLPAPDAVFLGGGLSDAAIWEAAWQSLTPGGRLVANAVTIEGEAALARWHERHGGELQRLSVAHAEPLGAQHGWRPSMTVTQLAVAKPRTAR